MYKIERFDSVFSIDEKTLLATKIKRKNIKIIFFKIIKIIKMIFFKIICNYGLLLTRLKKKNGE
jgi:hypothetical protein